MLGRWLKILLLLTISGCSLIFGASDEPHFLYSVQAGDTVYEIAKKFGVSTDVILEHNEIDDPKQLQIGQIIQIPEREPTANGAASKRSTSRAPRYVDLGAAAHYIGRLKWPLPNGMGRATSSFGWRGSRFHEGLDLSAPSGTTIYAAHAGKVIFSGRGLSGYGNMIVIKAAELVTVYGHNSSNSVDRGDYVNAGDEIGEVGATGHATGPHLHFEVRIPNDQGGYVAVDPKGFYRN